ncbi:MAG: VOC family protein, partial [Burkholderiales bacterium]
MKRPYKFAQVVYGTRQYAKMVEWYRSVFDARVQHQDSVISFLAYDDEHHRVAFVNLEVLDPENKLGEQRGTLGVDHLAYTFRSMHDLFDNYAELKERGILPY